MSRRCKPGQRARIVNNGSDCGKIVLVVRHYFGEKIAGSTWVQRLYPWVVASLSGPIDWHREGDPSITGSALTAVFDDCELEPLDDDDDGLTRTTEKDKPVKKPAKARKPSGTLQEVGR